MNKFKVTTPSKDFSGKRHGVQFYKGEAVTELTKEQVNEFKSWGYILEEMKEKKEEAPKKPSKVKTKKNDK